MKSAPIPAREAERLHALEQLCILDTPPDPAYDEIARLAAWICDTPISLVSLVASDRQWFKAGVGVRCTETSRDVSICAHALLQDEIFIVPDTRLDERFASTPCIVGDSTIRFYAGAPVAAPDGQKVGTLCVLDRVPRDLTPEQKGALRVLARQISTLLELRHKASERDRASDLLRASEGRFRAFMDKSPACAFIKDPNGRYLYINEQAARRFNIPVDIWIGRTDLELWSREQAEVIREHDTKVLREGATGAFIETLKVGDQTSYWRSYKFALIDDGGQRMLGGMSVEVTPEKNAEDALRASEEKFRNVVERLADAVFLVDVETKAVLEPNDATVRMFGYSEEELTKLTLYDLSTHDRTSVDENCRLVLARGRFWAGRRKYRRSNGTLLDVELNASVVTHTGQRVFSVVARDVTAQRQYEERLAAYHRELQKANTELRALAVTDGLTRVGNRAAFNQRLAEESQRCTRTERVLSLILLDVDRFKNYNDSFGHPAGDEVLQTIARMLQRSARNSDFVARYGGEEFALLLPDTDQEGALVLAERCRRAIASVSWEHAPVTVSLGIASMPPAKDVATLVTQADGAMYLSKQAGRDRVSSAVC